MNNIKWVDRLASAGCHQSIISIPTVQLGSLTFDTLVNKFDNVCFHAGTVKCGLHSFLLPMTF